MQISRVTTPFGRRPMSLALVTRQVALTEIKPGKSADKWKIFRDISEARELLGLQDRSLAVLDALLSFYPDKELRQDAQLVVFPSNAQLTVRAHGIAGATLRRHLAALVEAGLIVRKDSANGKRFARKDRAGDIEAAFGFDISPLLLRSEELAGLAQQVAANRAAFRRAKERLTICRRDVRKLITAAVEEGAPGNWHTIEGAYIDLVARIPRSPTLSDMTSILAEMSLLQQEVLNLLEMQRKDHILSTCDAQNERHIQNSNTESHNESEPRLGKRSEEKPNEPIRSQNRNIPAFSLGFVLRACPEIGLYGPGGGVNSWRDLMAAAVVVRSMLRVDPSAYEDACEAMGPENAAVAMACILERAGHINSAGGYLRGLTSRARRGEFSLGPALMARLRVNGESNCRVG